MDKLIYEQIIKKKEFSQLPRKDVEIAFSHFEKRQVSEVEKIRLTRELLHKVFGAFLSSKLLNKKIINKKTTEEILKKHLSTKERFEFYLKLYKKIFYDSNEKVSVIDLGSGINGLSYNFIKKSLILSHPLTHEIASLRSDIDEDINNLKNSKVINLKKNRANVNEREKLENKKINYIAVESVGQLVELINYYFIGGEIKNAKAIHLSLFELEKLKILIDEQKGKKIIFLFKVIDSLEMLERDYSKKLLREIVNLSDVEKVVVSFATKSLVSKKRFKAKRYWFENFVKEEFNLLENFEMGGEKYFVLGKK